MCIFEGWTEGGGRSRFGWELSELGNLERVVSGFKSKLIFAVCFLGKGLWGLYNRR